MAKIRLDDVTLEVPTFLNFNNYIPDKKQRVLLNTINLDIPDGSRVGIVGLNGAGKSTLLRTLLGVYSPTYGKITIEGSVGGLLDNGIGFEQESTGYENIYYRSYLLGKSKIEIQQRIDSIIDFSGLRDQIHIPIKYYSTGMGLRLNFAIATEWIPDILLFDEVVGAGDKNFFEKSMKRIDDNINSTSITIIASHNHAILREYCSSGIWMEEGSVKIYSKLEEVLNKYEAS